MVQKSTPRRSLRERRSIELRRLRRAHYAQRIWYLGDRVEYELIEYLIAEFDLDQDRVDRILDRFADLYSNHPARAGHQQVAAGASSRSAAMIRSPIVEFRSREIREKFEEQVLEALRRAHPEAFAGGGAA